MKLNELLRGEGRTYRVLSVLFFLFVICLCLYSLKISPLVQLKYGHDSIVALDGAWRIVQGQTPHVDFHFVFGSLYLYLIAAGMTIGGATAASITIAMVIVTIVCSVWAYALLYRKMDAIPAFIFLFALAIYALSPNCPGHTYSAISYEGEYTRIGFLLLFLLCIERFFLAESSQAGPPSIFRGVSTGLLLGVLFFIKINIFAIGVFLALASILIYRKSISLKWFAGLMGGGVVFFFAYCLITRIPIASVFADYSLSVSKIDRLLKDDFYYNQTVPLQLPTLLVFAVFASVYIGGLKDTESESYSVIKRLFSVICMLLSAIAMALTNYGTIDSPIFLIIAGYLAVLIFRGKGSVSLVSGRGLIPLAGVLLILFIPLSQSLLAYSFARTEKNDYYARTLKFTEAPLANYLMVRADGYQDYRYIERVNDGCAILRRISSPSDRVSVLEFDNPFSFALGRPGAKGDYLYWQYNNNFDLKRYPLFDEVFKNTSIFMLPKGDDPEAATPLWSIYGARIKQECTLAFSDDLWSVYKR